MAHRVSNELTNAEAFLSTRVLPERSLRPGYRREQDRGADEDHFVNLADFADDVQVTPLSFGP